ncbi:MAG TPA: phosphoserine transaminase [Phycisphaerae bacterium]|nr:phosphoserine transaminase [Phycisphaerae bacterium]HOJ74222.1 phosphoserine transaminase [Phycisphaerae bacterium]HOM51301.1 phosphoserine transaminase [Phycisphaerae bacterium]HPP26735.1 phosphoserine transaminase [Phycisphaerae bacterium]HPU28606.1 phosphoserine transaminase [Phycisphaerae bacterium]
MEKPTAKPSNPNFSSGPTAKRPGWSPNALSNALLGRSHRSKPGKARLKQAIDLSKELAGMPQDYLLGIMPGSDTGAFEAAMWSMLGARPITALAWESFGEGWVTDITKQLKLDAKVLRGEYGQIADLKQVDWNTDVVFTWNGTTSGVKMPDNAAPPADREGLAFCDATSAVYAMPIPWERLDVITWSWQKCLGGEAAHGMLALSPRAVQRLETYKPSWPLPKIFRMTKAGKLAGAIFEGDTINTPSMLAVEDWIDTLNWAKNFTFEGKTGLQALFARSQANLKVVADFVAKHDWIDFLAASPEIRSSTSICLKVTAPWFTALSNEDKQAFIKKVAGACEAEKAVYDIAGYREAPPGFRFWGGPTVDPADTRIALEWLAWAYETNKPR